MIVTWPIYFANFIENKEVNANGTVIIASGIILV